MTNDNIRRLIQNQRSEHSPHTFSGTRGGMKDFNLLYPVLAKLPVPELQKWMRMIDAMRARHEGCGPYYSKILAYSILFTQGRDPLACQHYWELYKPCVARHFTGDYYRDVIGEVQASLHGTGPKTDKPKPTGSWAPFLEHLKLMDANSEEDRRLRQQR